MTRPCSTAPRCSTWLAQHLGSASRRATGDRHQQAYAGVHAPDIVGSIRVDQAWGLFQISGAAHEVNGSYNSLPGFRRPGRLRPTCPRSAAIPTSKWGGSVMAALQIKNLPTGAGDDFKIDATYAKGDTKQVISTCGGSPSFAMFGGSGRATRASASVPPPTGVSARHVRCRWRRRSHHLTKAWGIRGAFNHNWDPYWSSSLFGS